MDELDVEGLFWVEGYDQEKVAGRLTFDRSAGAKLSLIGTFEDAPRASRLTIFGVADRHELTLVGCMSLGRSMSMPGVAKQSFRPEAVLSGAIISSADESGFGSVSASLESLHEWGGLHGVSSEMRASGLNDGSPQLMVQLHEPPFLEVRALGGILRLRPRSSFSDNGSRGAAIGLDTYFEFEPGDPMQLVELLRIVSWLQDLLIVCAGRYRAVLDVSVKHRSHSFEIADGRIHSPPIRVFRQPINPAASTGNSRTHDLLLDLPRLGGLDVVARWLTIAEEEPLVIASVVAHQHMQAMYGENRLLNVAYAAEVLHRIRDQGQSWQRTPWSSGEFRRRRKAVLRAVPTEEREWLGEKLLFANEFPLALRLGHLAAFAGPSFQSIVGDPVTWAQAFAKRRNRAVHRGGRRDHRDGERLLLLSETGYLLIISCVLRLCGAEPAVLSAFTATEHASWVARRWRQFIGPDQDG